MVAKKKVIRGLCNCGDVTLMEGGLFLWFYSAPHPPKKNEGNNSSLDSFILSHLIPLLLHLSFTLLSMQYTVSFVGHL